MDSRKELLSVENGAKLLTLIVGGCSLYFAIKSDIRDLTTSKHFENEHLQYQINELKYCCGAKKRKENDEYVFNQRAITPNKIELEDER
jgi:hypothetical protein